MFGSSRPDYSYDYDDETGGWGHPFEWSEGEGEPGRALWTPEMRASFRNRLTPMTPPELCPAPLFCDRVAAAIEQSSSPRGPLAVVVLRMDAPPTEPRRQQALEMAVRMGVRKGDVPARLDEATFAVLLPETDHTAVIVAARLQQAISNITGRPATSGVAYYPEDAATAMELLEMASGRSSRESRPDDFNCAPAGPAPAAGQPSRSPR